MLFGCPDLDCRGEIEMEQFYGEGVCPECKRRVKAQHDCIYDPEDGSDCFDYALFEVSE